MRLSLASVLVTCSSLLAPVGAGTGLAVGGSFPATPGSGAGQAVTLSATSSTSSSVSLRFTEMESEDDSPVEYEIRFGTPRMTWDSGRSVEAGSCAAPLVGRSPGTARECTVEGLRPGTLYEFQLAVRTNPAAEDTNSRALSNRVTYRTRLEIEDQAEKSGDTSAREENRDTGTPPASPNEPTRTSAAEPILEEDFSDYSTTADLLSDPRGIYAEVSNASRIVLDTTQGVGPFRQSMRYDIPDRTDSDGRCNGYTVGRNLSLPGYSPGNPAEHVWLEVWLKFSGNFRTAAPRTWNCSSAVDYKLLFGRVSQPNRGRFSMKIGKFGDRWTLNYPDGTGSMWEDNSPPASRWWNDRWFKVRMEMKVSSDEGRPDGLVRAWIYDSEGHLVNAPEITDQVIDRGGIWGIALGRNRNQGPGEAMSMWYGLVRVWDEDPGW